MKFQEEAVAGLPVTTTSKDGRSSLSPGSLLVEQAQKHTDFLERIHATGVTLQQLSRASVERYTNVWLPLVAELGSDAKLLPPPDIAWMWHCHRLAPFFYQDYTEKRFGRLIEPNILFDFQDESSDDLVSVTTRKAWLNKNPSRSFFLVDEEEESVEMGESTTLSKLVGGFDLVGSCLRQGRFLWQISRPCFRDENFLRNAEMMYCRFLALRTGDDKTALIPTFPIDLMWHTHILVSIQNYNDECVAIRGEKFNHDDSFDDRSPGGELDVSFKITCQLWEKAYGGSYVVPGAMYRGEPPAAYFDRTWTPSLLMKTCKLSTEDSPICPAAGCGGGCGGGGCGNRGAAGCGGGCGGGGCGNRGAAGCGGGCGGGGCGSKQ